jgi:hypothetical protein
MIYAMFVRRNHGGSHAKLKEDAISLAKQRSNPEEKDGKVQNGGSQPIIDKVQPEIFSDEGRDENNEEWTANFSATQRDSAAEVGVESVQKNDSGSRVMTLRLPTNPNQVGNNSRSFSRMSPSSFLSNGANNKNMNKDAVIEALKVKCKALRDKVLQYGDVDRYSESETAMSLEREKYRLRKELKVVKSQLKFTNNALEDTVQKLQDHTLEKASMAEIIDNQKDEIHDFKLKYELLQKEVRELKRQIHKLEEERSSLGDDEEDDDTNKNNNDKSSGELLVGNGFRSSSDEINASSSRENGSKENQPIDDEHIMEKIQPAVTSNPFDDESITSTFRNPFEDDNSALSQSHSQRESSTRNPFGNNENVNTDNNNHNIDTHYKSADESMQKQLAELQAKYAQKMAEQLSKIAALQEDNDIKDIQLKNLQERLEKQQDESGHRRRFGTWRRNNDAKQDEEPTSTQLEAEV